MERLNKTTSTNAKHSVRNTNFCLFLQYLGKDLAISQISREVLQKHAKLVIWSREYCMFLIRVLKTLETLLFRRCITHCAKCLSISCFCSTSRMTWPTLTRQALLRRPLQRQKTAIVAETCCKHNRLCRFLFKTPSALIRRSLGLPSGGPLAS